VLRAFYFRCEFVLKACPRNKRGGGGASGTNPIAAAPRRNASLVFANLKVPFFFSSSIATYIARAHIVCDGMHNYIKKRQVRRFELPFPDPTINEEQMGAIKKYVRQAPCAYFEFEYVRD
jgi:hypothetical protein